MRRKGRRLQWAAVGRTAAMLTVALSLMLFLLALCNATKWQATEIDDDGIQNKRQPVQEEHARAQERTRQGISENSRQIRKETKTISQDDAENCSKEPARETTGHQSHSLHVAPIGRLGNQMFQYASAFAIATQTNQSLMASPLFELWAIFEGLTAKPSDPSADTAMAAIVEDYPGTYDTKLMHLPASDVHIKLCCFLQSWKYFHQAKPELRTQYTFRSSIMDSARALFENYVAEHFASVSHHQQRSYSQGGMYIGVHVRRGDLVTTVHARRGYKVAPRGYILRAMNYYRNKYQGLTFLVFSDFPDKDWCQENIVSHDVIQMGYHLPETDLAMLSLCNHTVITVGTFSWWAGWLAGGEVVYYPDWLTPGTEMAQAYSTNDYFPEHWIPIR